jgi:hypothetical protein
VGSEWFRRFGDIPGVEYSAPPGIVRSKLTGANAKPSVERFGEGSGLWWGDGSQSPAAARSWSPELERMEPAKARRYLAETLELPGEAVDYHFAIQHVVEQFWKQRRDNPSLRTDIEELSWLDLRFLVAHPDVARIEHGDSDAYFQIRGIGYLMTMYEQEGAWRDALDVADLAARTFGQMEERRDELAEIVAALDAEVTG